MVHNLSSEYDSCRDSSIIWANLNRLTIAAYMLSTQAPIEQTKSPSEARVDSLALFDERQDLTENFNSISALQ